MLSASLAEVVVAIRGRRTVKTSNGSAEPDVPEESKFCTGAEALGGACWKPAVRSYCFLHFPTIIQYSQMLDLQWRSPVTEKASEHLTHLEKL